MGSLFLYRSIGSAKDHERFLDLDILQSLEIITGGVPHLQLTVEKF